MRAADPGIVDLVQRYRPICSRCGTLTQLARIEPCDTPDHELRTFECLSCGNADIVTVKVR